MSEPSAPIPADADLHDFAFVPIFRAQLFRSSFCQRATDAEFRAAGTAAPTGGYITALSPRASWPRTRGATATSQDRNP